MNMSPTAQKFIIHWGEMGTRWGINRTVAQVHALLYISPNPLNAEEITETLSVARSNVSTCLRELQSWRIVKVVHVMGDRRDHFESMKDVWEMFRVILEERKRREIDPTLAVLRECAKSAQEGGKEEEYQRKRLEELLGFFETMTAWYHEICQLSTSLIIKFVRLGGKVTKMLGRAS